MALGAPLALRFAAARLAAPALGIASALIASTVEAIAVEAADWSVIAIEEVPVAEASRAIALKDVPGRFRGFRVRSPDARYTITGVQILYADGARETDRRRIGLRPGQSGPILFRTEDGRFVDEITLSFRVSRSGRGNRVVELSGLQTAEDRAARRDVATAQIGGNSETADAATGDDAQPAVLPPVAAPDKIRDSGPLLPSRPARSATSPAGDVLLGGKRIEGAVDRLDIAVPARIGRFSKIRLRVIDGDVGVTRVTLTYDGGRNETREVAVSLKPAKPSDWIAVDGQAFLDKIAIGIDPSANGAGSPKIEVFGAHADGWLGANGEGRKFNGGWVLLAAQTAGFLGFDTDEIVVDEEESAIRALKISVRQRAITLDRLRVVYRDGRETVIPAGSKVGPGDSYGPVEVDGGKTGRDKDGVARIEARYRSRYIDGERQGGDSAIVEIWAKH